MKTLLYSKPITEVLELSGVESLLKADLSGAIDPAPARAARDYRRATGNM